MLLSALWTREVIVETIFPALTWHQFLWPCTGSSFPALGTHPLFPVLDFYLLLKEYLTNLSNIIVRRPVASKAERFLSFYQLQNGTVEIHDPELEEQLSLSTADLRFADYLIHHVNEYTEKGEQEAGWFSAVKKKIFGHRTLFASTLNPGLSLLSSLVIPYWGVCLCLGYFLRKDQVTVFVSWWIIIYDMKNNIKLVASNNFAILRRSRRSVIIHKVILGFSDLVIFRSCLRSVCCSAAFLLYDKYMQ